MDTNELIFLNALNSIPGVGVAILRMLKSRIGSFANIWRNDIRFLQTGAFSKPINQIIASRASLDPEKEFKKLEHHGIWIMIEDDPLFPSQLREIPHAPLLLYGKGTRPDSRQIMIAIVGTRRPTAYGREAAIRITERLARAQMTIVSGLAVGIDTIAHETTLAEKAVTIAVIGSGLDERSLFPQQNVLLSRRIIEEHGAIISEYAPGTPPMKEHFPLRNRIISGLSRGVLILEARERSGALITARTALEQNRDVFAVPGSIFSPTSVGTNMLIQEGAKLVTTAQHICEEWNIEQAFMSSHAENLDKHEKIMVKLLECELTIDELKEKTGFDTPFLISTLSLLELKGIIRNLGNDTYQVV